MLDKTTKAAISCRLCGEQASFVWRATVLGRHDVAYFQCSNCGLLQTEVPYWLEEAYSSAISSADTGIMVRNLHLMKVVAVLLRFLGMRDGTFLDYGGGHGIFTRLMRDHGFNFLCWDPHAENLFARGFEGDPDGSYKGVTAFEVLEHLVEPGTFFRQILGEMRPDVFFATTELLPEPVDRNWHYFCFPTGQHIAFYQRRTLEYIANEHNYQYISTGWLHLFTRRDSWQGRKEHALRWLVRLAPSLFPFMHFSSLAPVDYEHRLQALRQEKSVQ